MLVRHLTYFTALARERHFARAAAASNVTQPTLSAAIKSLEDELGVRLVERRRSFIGLTPAGEKLLDWGRLILADYDSLRAAISDSGEGLSGTLRLGIIPSAAPAAPLLTARFAAAHPRAIIDVRTISSRALLRALNAFEIDGGITYLDVEPLERIIAQPLYTERYVFLTKSTHPLASRNSISWAEAFDQPLCLLSSEMRNRRTIDSIAAAAGLQLQPRLISDSLLGLWNQVVQGPWSSIVPNSLPSMFGANMGVIAIPLNEPDQGQEVGLVVLERDPRSPMADALFATSKALDFHAALAFASLRMPDLR